MELMAVICAHYIMLIQQSLLKSQGIRTHRNFWTKICNVKGLSFGQILSKELTDSQTDNNMGIKINCTMHRACPSTCSGQVMYEFLKGSNTSLRPAKHYYYVPARHLFNIFLPPIEHFHQN